MKVIPESHDADFREELHEEEAKTTFAYDA